ncbi:MAG: alkaline phosphatase [Phycisphaeraceae bacterium]|nr:alkaline phosphatase [Phycisphaeraceae bacterium]
MITRREALKASSAALLGSLAAYGTAPQASANNPSTPRARRGRSTTRNIIFMVSDGMSMGVPTLTESLSLLVRKKKTHWTRLANLPAARQGVFNTESRNSMVTDSSAASCAWASGVRINNGVMNMLPGDHRLTPIGELVNQSGRKLGLVTTAFATHATPAGFIAVSRSRGDYPGIAAQYLNTVDVIMGGGRPHFMPGGRHDRRDLEAEFAEAGYGVYHDRNAILRADRDKPMLGLFHESHLPYTLDQMNDRGLIASVPTLAEMSKVALERMSRHRGGFLLQIEGARIDHAAHLNDAAGILWDQIAFDDAIGVVLDFMKDRDDTLLIVTSDHGNANPGLNSMGGRWGSTNDCFQRLPGFNTSFQIMRAALADAEPDEAPAMVEKWTGLSLFDDDKQSLIDMVRNGPPKDLNAQHRNVVGTLGQILGNYIGIQFTGVNHTSDWMPILSLGPGSERFGHYLMNTDFFTHMVELMGIDYANKVPEGLTLATEHERALALSHQY